MSITGMGDMITASRALYEKVTRSNTSYVDGRAKEGGKGDKLTKIFRKIRLESKWNTTFWFVLSENFREQQNI